MSVSTLVMIVVMIIGVVLAAVCGKNSPYVIEKPKKILQVNYKMKPGYYMLLGLIFAVSASILFLVSVSGFAEVPSVMGKIGCWCAMIFLALTYGYVVVFAGLLAESKKCEKIARYSNRPEYRLDDVRYGLNYHCSEDWWF